MTNDSKYLYKIYIEQLQYKIDICRQKLLTYQTSCDYLKDVLLSSSEEFAKYDINIEQLLLHPNVAYVKIQYLLQNGHLSKVGQYVKLFASAYRQVTLFTNMLTKLENCIIPYELYRELVFTMNKEIAKYILEGGIFTFGTIGKIFIVEKENKAFTSFGTRTSLRTDWGRTKIKKQELQRNGVDLYNKNTNPTGTKYYVYHNNAVDYWWVWLTGIVNNRSFYRFYPTSYTHNVGRSVDSYVAKAKSTNQILETTALGNEDKMRALLRFDPLYYIRYQRPDFDGRRFLTKQQFNNMQLITN